MKYLAMGSILVACLGLSACSHFGHRKSCCAKSECKMENKEKCEKDSKECANKECELKK
ncbi:MAG: hypothetical protein IPM97_06460 [Bdellovibrionaceae bacterium]|nr:hypothetical protein [Pseudobdellovibrionaceae bacterium]